MSHQLRSCQLHNIKYYSQFHSEGSTALLGDLLPVVPVKVITVQRETGSSFQAESPEMSEPWWLGGGMAGLPEVQV